MSIEIRCENCGKNVRAKKELAGKRAKCPGCGHEFYVPMAPNELEALDLVPENPDDLAREAQLQAERRQLDRSIAQEKHDAGANEVGDWNSAPVAGGAPAAAGSSMMEKGVLAFLTAMRDSDLDRAERALERLRLQPTVAREIVDRLATDQIPPSEMANVPPVVFQGFLKNLRSQL